MKIFVVVKTALECTGEFAAATTEGAFQNEALARQWLMGKQIVWEEMVNGTMCYCERAVHETELTENG